MKKPKHSPKKLPEDKEGFYAILDPHRYIESNLINWYGNIVCGHPAYIPSAMMHYGIFTEEENDCFLRQIREHCIDFEKRAYMGFENLFPYFEYPTTKNQKIKFTNSLDYRYEISVRIAAYKALLRIEPEMERIIERDKFAKFKEHFGKVCITPGQPEQRFLQMLIKDVESVSDEWFPKQKNKTYRPILAFYLAKLDIFEDLECEYKKKSQPCSATDCIEFRKEKCKRAIEDYYAKRPDLSIEPSILIRCKKRLTYSDCKKCKSNFGYELGMNADIAEKEIREIKRNVSLFLRTPCKPARDRYNDIIDRIEKIKYRGFGKGMHIADIEILQKELCNARQSNDRKTIIAIYKKAKELYPYLSRKEIQRTLVYQA